MASTILVLSLLLCVAASAIVVRVSRLPLPLTQIALGAAISLPSFGLHVDLDPHLFLLIFVPPLLFADGWRVPKREFFKMRERILALALGLVLLTVVAVGYLLHWLIPALPLAAAFALAAVLSPTDAVSVSALAGRAGIPKQLLYTLQGEALMNDASGLTAFNFAIAAAVTGTFSLEQASLSFVLVAAGGLLIGAAMGWAMAAFQKWLTAWSDIEAQGTIMMILLLPFAAYLMAERFHTSGILAAVAAGMTLNLAGAGTEPGAGTRVATGHIWEMLEYMFNGVIFVLMGLQLPDIIGEALKDAYQDAGFAAAARLLSYALITSAALIFVRLAWVWTMVHLTKLLQHVRGADSRITPPWRLMFLAALGGVRGAITLAGVLSVPLVLEDGSAFPERSLMIFIAASVILISLLAASVGMPPLLRDLAVEEDWELREERAARQRACEAAIAAIAEEAKRLGKAESSARGSDAADDDASVESPSALAASRLIDRYQLRLRALVDDPETSDIPSLLATVETLRIVGLRAERAAILRMHRADEINNTILNTLLVELDMRESSLKLA